jgi:HlyD family secretion protein
LFKKFIHLIKTCFFFFEKKEKINFLFLSFYLIISGVFEVLNLLMIGLFLKAMSNPNYAVESFSLNNIFFFLDLNESNVQLYLAVALCVSLIVSSFFNLFINWKTYNYICDVSTKISRKIFFYYLHQDYSFHFLNEKSELIKKITYDLDRTINGIFLAILAIISKLVITIFIFCFLFYLNFFITILVISFLSLFYIIFFTFIKNKLSIIGNILTTSQNKQFKVLQESMGGIKEIILTNSQDQFYNSYSSEVENYNKKYSDYLKITHLPRSILELLSVITIIFILIIITKFYGNNIYTFLPTLGVYALAGLRTIPAVQTFFQGISQIKNCLPSSKIIYEDFAKYKVLQKKIDAVQNTNLLNFEKTVVLKNISYHYPLIKNNIIKNINLTIKKNQLTSIIGPNGSGKSTLINIILGILKPQEGNIYIDQTELTNDNVITWQKKIGYVSQDIFLFNDTILNNITFGIKNQKFNIEDIEKIIKDSGLQSFINLLPEGINTRVGENGIYLSGGQKQKIAIARCLIRNAEIIILDEATSALDVQSESNLNDIIKNFINKKTLLVVTHKFENIKNSNIIFLMEEGSIKKSGKYDDVFKV